MKTLFIPLMLLCLFCQIACVPEPISPNADLDGVWKISEVSTLGFFHNINDRHYQYDIPSKWVFNADGTASLQFSSRSKIQNTLIFHLHWSGTWTYDSSEDQINLIGTESTVIEDESTNQQDPQPDDDIDLLFQIEALQNDSLELSMTKGEDEAFWHFYLYRD